MICKWKISYIFDEFYSSKQGKVYQQDARFSNYIVDANYRQSDSHVLYIRNANHKDIDSEIFRIFAFYEKMLAHE